VKSEVKVMSARMVKGRNTKTNHASSDGEYVKTRARTLIMVGLGIGMLVASLDQTVVGTSLPKIVGELGGMSLFSWLFTAYMLAETITIPIAGKMSDLIGRRPVFLAGMGLFLGGSVLAGVSNSMEMLVAFRFIQGLGGGVLIPITMASVADFYSPMERGKIQGMIGALFALGSVIGPFLGGFIVDNVDWRWVFFINIPLGVFAIAVTMAEFPRVVRENIKRVDYPGVIALIGTLTPALLVMTWGGSTYAWTSREILSLAAVSFTSFAAVILIESKAEDPVLPLHLFKEPIFTLGSIGLLIIAMGLFGVVAYVPLFLQAVIGMNATNSGITLIPLMAGLMMTLMVSGVLIKRTGFKIWLLIGPPLTAFGLIMLSTLHSGSSQEEAILYLIIAGAGMGAVFSNYISAAQNVTRKHEMGVVTSSMSLFRSIGGTIGVTVLGAILRGRMVLELGRNLPPGSAAYLPGGDAMSLGGVLITPSAASELPQPVLDAIGLSLSNSITYLFVIGAVISIFALGASILIRGRSLNIKDDRVMMDCEEMDSTGSPSSVLA
jgi:EmrB/QacA subfamily drug resistance transporter